MSYSIHVLCRDRQPVTRREIASFIEDGVYFDEPSFRPHPDSDEAAMLMWDHLKVMYDKEKLPIIIHSFPPSEVHRVLNIVDGTFDEQSVTVPPAVTSHLAGVTQAFELEFDRGGGMSDDCWEMLDAVEAHLAQLRDGMIFVHDEGMFDARLQPIVKW
jgi:hypothetical protein